jgi:hypothetical protein
MSDDGGPAFPVAESDKLYGSYGMTLRDWFAGQALAGDISADDVGTVTGLRSKEYAAMIAARAYQMADAMLEARKEPKA